MNITSPTECRAEAVRQGRLATEAMTRKDHGAARRHIDRARELTLLAVKLEQDDPKGV